MALPLLLIGDSPRRSTGLARIARDLASRISTDRTLDVELVQACPDDGQGIAWQQWPFYGLPVEEWGAPGVPEVWRDAFGDRPGVVLTVWDPARCWSLLQARSAMPETSWWGYFPVDARTKRGPFGGPAAQAVRSYQRVLGYGLWGAEVLEAVTGRGSVSYLPHGIDNRRTSGPFSAQDVRYVREVLGRRVTDDTILIGCVAANQARKDLGSYCETLRVLLDRGLKVHGWLHTDKEIGTRETQWVVPQLAEEYGLQRALSVTQYMTDTQLAAFYATCTVTIAPGLGEGFGYPIVESLACGTPVIHSTYGGGSELVPRAEWRIPVRAERVEGPYALVRPVYAAEDLANAVERAVAWRRREPEVVREFCRGAVAHLEWTQLWPRWASWLRQGVREF
jgi:glycosyltransferase involved in cell wall biosynthesis